MLQPGTKVDRFIVEALVGKGTTSEVYRVRHVQLGTHHALKLLKEGQSEDLRRRMEREARLQAKLRHPNIVPVTDVVVVDGRFGLIQDYVEGPTLRQALKRFSIDLDGALGLFRGIVAGVRCAHGHGLVHRDLKPANIVLFKALDGYVPKITDFGLTKQLLEGREEFGQTQVGITMGTPGYMAPEQSLDARVADQRADIFSLGCLLYEMVTGHRTFTGKSNFEVLRATQRGEFDCPLKHKPELPDAICRVIEGCLAVERNQRFSDCDSLLAVLNGQEVSTGTIVPTQDEPEGSTLTDMTWFVPQEQLQEIEDDEPQSLQPQRTRRFHKFAFASLLLVTSAAAATWVDELTEPFARTSVEESAQELEDTAVQQPDGPGVVTGELQNNEGQSASVVAESKTSKSATAPAGTSSEPTKVKQPRRSKPKPSSLLLSKKTTAAPEKKKASKGLGRNMRRARMAALVSAVAVQPGQQTPSVSRRYEAKILTQPPAAQIRVDGRTLGRSPMKVTLEAGQHEVQVESDGNFRSFVIDVDAREANRWCYEFERDVFRKGRCVL